MKYIRPVVGLLKSGKDADQAIDYGYRFLRLHFDRIEAHNAYIRSFISDPQPTMPPSLEVVGSGAAVCYQESSKIQRWVVIEETDQPLSEFEEISSKAPLARELMGKRVGDRFTLAKGSISSREATIKQIMPKYVRRFQDSIEEMQVRFGPASAVESIQIESSDDPLQLGLASFLASLQKRAADVADAKSTYINQPISLHLFGARFGKNAYAGLMSLALSEGQPIKCCVGSAEEREQAASALRTASTVVIDLTAIATLRLLGLDRILATKQFRFALTEGAWTELNSTLFESTSPTMDGGIVSYSDGRYTLYEESAEARTRRKKENEDFLQHVRANVEVIPGLSLASVEPSTRELLEKFLGQYGAEAVALARSPAYVLWTDDFVEAQLGAELFGIRRVWTQLILASLAEAGLIGQQEYSVASAKLVGMQFMATTFNCSAMSEAARLTDLSPSNSPLKQIIDVFSNPQRSAQELFRLFAEFAVKLHHEDRLPERKCLVLWSLLDAFWQNHASHKFLLNMRKFSSR